MMSSLARRAQRRDEPDVVAGIIDELLRTTALAPAERDAVQRICAQWASLDDILDAAAGPREPIGELLLAAGRISRSQLDRALAEQKYTHERLGEVLVRKGWLGKAELTALLAFQHRLEATRAGRAGPLQLGNLLVSTGRISARQLQDGIARQSRSKERLGEALVATGAISELDVARGLKLQRLLIGIALSAALALSGVPKASAGTSAMRVAANVLPYLRLQILRQAPNLDVTAEDVERGYVDVAAATDLMAKSNDHNGFSLSFDARSNLFRKAQVSGLDQGLELGPEGGMAHQGFTGPQKLVHLSYRFFLAPQIVPGSYPWPLQISSTVMY